jgi:hypothetical protein
MFIYFINQGIFSKSVSKDFSTDSNSNFNKLLSSYFISNPLMTVNPIFFKNFYKSQLVNLSETKPAPLLSVLPTLLPTRPVY